MPVIAAIQGRCWGGGMQIALGADYRIARPDASLCIMEAKWGIIPDMGGTLPLRELLSVDIAMQLASTAIELSGEQAKAIGLVSATASDPLAAAQELAQQFVARSPDSVAAVKRLYRRAWSQSERQILTRETLYQWRLLLGANQKIATRRAQNKSDLAYRMRLRWW